MFRQQRKETIERCVVETNKLLIRLEKVGDFLYAVQVKPYPLLMQQQILKCVFHYNMFYETSPSYLHPNLRSYICGTHR